MDQITLVKNKYRLEQWINLIQDCKSSGMKVDDWCEANGVTHHAYYYWLRKVRNAACKDLFEDIQSNEMTEFQKLEFHESNNNSQVAITINLPYVTLEIHNGIEQGTMEAVLNALKSTC